MKGAVISSYIQILLNGSIMKETSNLKHQISNKSQFLILNDQNVQRISIKMLCNHLVACTLLFGKLTN
jgi:hypothetical protein